MSIRGYEQGVDGSRLDENWTEEVAKSQGRITDLGLYPYVPARYIVFKRSATYYRRDGETGIVDDSNADATTLINAAFAALTAGRTWKEKVYVLGDIAVATTVAVPSYGILELDGRMKLDDNADTVLVELSGDYSELMGGVLDGNGANQTGGNRVLQFDDVIDSSARRVRVINSYNKAIEVDAGYRNLVAFCQVDDAGLGATGSGHGIMFWSSAADYAIYRGHLCIGNTVLDTNRNSIDVGTTSGIGVFNNSIYNGNVGIAMDSVNHVRSQGNIIYNPASSGETVVSGFGGAMLDVLLDNDIYSSGSIGSQVKTTTNTISDIEIRSRVYNSTSHGVVVNADNGGISNVKLSVKVNTTGGATHGIRLRADAGDTLAQVTSSNSQVYGATSYALRLEGAGTINNVRFIGGYLQATTGPYSDAAGASSNIQIRNVLGYVTENDGTGSILNTATTDVIAHGCDYTPLLADITITLGENPTNTPGAIWVDTVGAANFTVNCENDPGASNLDFSWAVRRVW